MSAPSNLVNRVKSHRQARGWSQEELAARAGISRSGLSAVEAQRLVPSAAAALGLAAALECRVEDLFTLASAAPRGSQWAWAPARVPVRFWESIVAGRTLRYPVEASPLGELPHDGVFAGEAVARDSSEEAARTLVMASCDPAVGLLAAELARHNVRLIVLQRSSREALQLLRDGLVHVAGSHLAGAKAVTGVAMLRGVHWQAGLAVGGSTKLRSINSALRGSYRWVGREVGSGARQCLDELLAGRKASPRMIARDHRGVAEAVRCGWADIGVCLKLVSDEAGLGFLPVRREAYDLCYRLDDGDDPRVRTLMRVVRSSRYRAMLSDLPGYDASQTGEMIRAG